MECTGRLLVLHANRVSNTGDLTDFVNYIEKSKDVRSTKMENPIHPHCALKDPPYCKKMTGRVLHSNKAPLLETGCMLCDG